MITATNAEYFSMSNYPNFLLVGQASHGNRGNEAIVRGTMRILRAEFGDDLHADMGVRCSPADLKKELPIEEPGIHVFSHFNHSHHFSPKWWALKANRFLATKIQPHTWDLKPYLSKARVALEVGGDCYSLDYGRPDIHVEIDRYLLSKDVPLVIWGASVGPFDLDPEYEPYILDHLRSVSGIFVREDRSRDYLASHGIVGNVFRMSDPAFVMQPIEPSPEKLGFVIPEGAIGLNLSPLAGKFRTSDGGKNWTEACVDIARAVAGMGRPLILVPHVARSGGDDDYHLLGQVRDHLAAESILAFILPGTLNAAEKKWVISKCAAFAGARTHATIAALSMCVPTLSIAYSVKAWGINEDIFGHTNHVIPVADLEGGLLRERLEALLVEGDAVRQVLDERIPVIQRQAYAAGPLLRGLCRQ